ncbi:MAG TPA: glycosyltransferase family 4 protein [Gaiellaceae bacterium]|nr:glycosyltransferase family 4 protein [Gaiellaceae bacterium]
MRVVLMTGIWPPDIGGPATHGPDFASFLRDRGHEVHVVTMADQEPTERPVPVEWVTRGRPFVVRYPEVAAVGFRLARRADVVYATATYAAAAAAAVGARRPLVTKLVSDPAYERARRYGLFSGTLEAFQSAHGARTLALKRLRTSALRRATRIIVPSRYLADFAGSWGLDRSRIEVLTNPAPPPIDVEPSVLAQGTFVFVGRLAEQKALPVALAALREVPDARLLLIGDGPERESLERRTHELGLDDRVRFLGSVSRDEVLRYLAGARAAVLSSAWENLPHAAVEALSVGTPVVSTAVGGVPEVVRDGENGLLVPAGDVPALATALRRMLDDDALRDRLAAGAQPSVAAIGRDATYERLERVLHEAVG